MDFSDLEKVIVTVKGQNVIIDSDVARIYGTETREIKLADAKEKPEQQSLMQRSGEIFSELIASDIPVSGTETTLEINFAVMKFKHTVKKEKKEK